MWEYKGTLANFLSFFFLFVCFSLSLVISSWEIKHGLLNMIQFIIFWYIHKESIKWNLKNKKKRRTVFEILEMSLCQDVIGLSAWNESEKRLKRWPRRREGLGTKTRTSSSITNLKRIFVENQGQTSPPSIWRETVNIKQGNPAQEQSKLQTRNYTRQEPPKVSQRNKKVEPEVSRVVEPGYNDLDGWLLGLLKMWKKTVLRFEAWFLSVQEQVDDQVRDPWTISRFTYSDQDLQYMSLFHSLWVLAHGVSHWERSNPFFFFFFLFGIQSNLVSSHFRVAVDILLIAEQIIDPLIHKGVGSLKLSMVWMLVLIHNHQSKKLINSPKNVMTRQEKGKHFVFFFFSWFRVWSRYLWVQPMYWYLDYTCYIFSYRITRGLLLIIPRLTLCSLIHNVFFNRKKK